MAPQNIGAPCVPFLRWAGGKRWLARVLNDPIRKLLSQSKGRYIEPFLGAGAMFFAVAPSKSIISDANSDLINCFIQVREAPDFLLSRLSRIPVTAADYYAVRCSSPRTDRGRAIRFIYLNRTCYGGLHRTNLRGEFNVPYGGGSRTPTALWRDGLLHNASRVLRQGRGLLLCGDFEERLDEARRGDVVYCDPTYHGVGRDTFDRYGTSIFGWDDQVRLKDAAIAAMRRGVVVLISNSVSDELSELYGSALQLQMRRSKSIGNKALTERAHRELLAVYDPFQRNEFWFSALLRIAPRVAAREVSRIKRHHRNGSYGGRYQAFAGETA